MWVLTFVLLITWVFRPCAGADLDAENLVYKVAIAARSYSSATENDLDVCITQLIHTAAAVENQTGWAIQMSVASGTPESGIYSDNVFWPASSYDCLTMSSKEEDHPPFQVAYFLLESEQNNSFIEEVSEKTEKDVVLSGLCLPASCSPAKLNLFSAALHRNTKLKNRVPYDQTQMYLTLRYTTIIILGLVLISTVYERIFSRNPNSKNSSINLYDVMTAFSFSKNYHKLFNMKKEDDMLLVLNGWRVFGTFVMISTHLMAYVGLHTKMKPPEEDLFTTQMMYATTLGVDDFFITGGFLLGYNFFRNNDIIRDKNIDKNMTKNLIEFLKGLLKRYLRLTPVYFYSILMCAVAYSYLAPTSSFNIKEQLDSACSQYWWTNMLYINNMYPSSEEYCMSWSYYLANDMQYYVLGSMLLYFSIFNKKLSVILGLAICFLAAMTIAGLVIYLDFTVSHEGLFKHVEIFYLAPWMRITAYLCGIFVAYSYTYNEGHFSKNPVAKTLLWTFYFSARMFNGFGLLWFGSGMWFSAFYMAGGRFLYALGDSVFFYFMVTDNIFKKLSAGFSKHMWIPLSKLSYGAYLINPLVISVSMISTEKVPLARNFHFLISAIGIIVITFALSACLVLFIEMPINNLVGVCFPKKSKKQNDIFYDCNVQRLNHEDKNK